MVYQCTTNFGCFGRFRVKVDSQNVFVGGPKYCVNIHIDETTTTLFWLSTEEGGCELDGKFIKSGETVKMVDLAFSILRTHFPERTEIVLLDDSGFSWIGPKHTKLKVNFLKGYLLLHRKTWYEDKFDATICNDDIYKEYRRRADNNFDDPSKKPESFSFGNASTELTPLYKESTTWGEFIQKMSSIYGSRKYTMMYHWYRQAIYSIFDGMEINQNWKIDLSKRPMIPCEISTASTASTAYKGGMTRKSNGIKKRKLSLSSYARIDPFHFRP